MYLLCFYRHKQFYCLSLRDFYGLMTSLLCNVHLSFDFSQCLSACTGCGVERFVSHAEKNVFDHVYSLRANCLLPSGLLLAARAKTDQTIAAWRQPASEERSLPIAEIQSTVGFHRAFNSLLLQITSNLLRTNSVCRHVR